MAKKKPEHAAWLPPPYELADVTALQALSRGEADKHQQERALKWIIEQACGTYQMSFRPGPDGERDTVFAEGRRFVGLIIVEKLKLIVANLRRNDEISKA